MPRHLQQYFQFLLTLFSYNKCKIIFFRSDSILVPLFLDQFSKSRNSNHIKWPFITVYKVTNNILKHMFLLSFHLKIWVYSKNPVVSFICSVKSEIRIQKNIFWVFLMRDTDISHQNISHQTFPIRTLLTMSLTTKTLPTILELVRQTTTIRFQNQFHFCI